MAVSALDGRFDRGVSAGPPSPGTHALSLLASTDRTLVNATHLTRPVSTGRAPTIATRHGWTRLIVGYVSVMAVMPYLIVKLMWIFGSTAGFLVPSPLGPTVLRNGNIVTVVMELVAIGVILAFTHSWGLRLPAWLVLVPAWVGIGLLVPFLVTGPVVAGSVFTGLSPAGDGSLAPWVGPLVYLGFGAQAIGIGASFLLYVRDRWGRVLARRVSDRPAAGSQPALVFMGWGIGGLLVPVVAARLVWSFGATWGLSAEPIESRGLPERLADGASALFAVAAIAGLLMLTRRRPARLRARMPIVLAWIGGGATLTGAAYSLALTVIKISGWTAAMQPMGVVPVIDLLQVVAGTAIAVVGAVLLAELNAAASPA